MPKAHELAIHRYRRWYALLLRFYSKPFREHFSESMEQTFSDLLQERAQAKKRLFAFTLWIFADTFSGIIKENSRILMMQFKDMIGILLGTAALLLVPLVAMQFSDEVVWGLGDFFVAGVLLAGTGIAFKFFVRRSGNLVYRAAAGVAIAASLLLIWTNLAVGIIGSENNLANAIYLCVLAVELIGSFLARFQPGGMARTLFATALTQALIAIIALMAGMHRYPGSSLSEIVNINGFFVALFIFSALLFRHAEGRLSQQTSPT